MSRHSLRSSDTGYLSRERHSDLSRSSYPSFLSLPDTLKLQLTWAWRGLVDAFRWDTVVRTVAGDPEIRANILKSLLLNSLSLTSIYAFDLLLLPLVRDQQKWLHRNVGWFYQALWLLPVVGTSLYLNSSWCTVIAKRTYTLQYGSRHAAPPASYSGMLTALATSAYRFVMVFTSVVVSFFLSYLPVVGPSVGFAFFCWVDAYYCFEFIWIARGLTLSQRIRYLEERWAYYFTFGFPPAAICMWGSGLANAALFALILPAYIIMAMHAHPLPVHPYNPLSHTVASDASVQYPSPFIPIRLPVFAPVIWLNDIIVAVLSVGVGPKSAGGRKRGMSESTVASVEEGTVSELVDIGNFTTASSKSTTPYRGVRSTGGLGRRKGD